ncbi:hypothetical protein PHISCL_01541 [Aspergillus sclerotialis]|uniref:Uncharacterized protein n=1 Tax=Aspergillus sclerotialis TaxID=2070753 RepID=A0A3A2ZSH1_9EURO|nr:hypothetical protein PHISCL_01541 [Aspergillus sclerotialis]
METPFSDLADRELIAKIATTIGLMEVYDKAIIRNKDNDFSTANLAEKLRTETDTLDLLIREMSSRQVYENEHHSADQATEEARAKIHKARYAMGCFVPGMSSIDEYLPAKELCQEILDEGGLSL